MCLISPFLSQLGGESVAVPDVDHDTGHPGVSPQLVIQLPDRLHALEPSPLDLVVIAAS